MTTERDAAIEAAAKAIDRAEIAWCSQNPDDSFSEMPCDIKARAAILAYDQHRAKQEPAEYKVVCTFAGGNMTMTRRLTAWKDVETLQKSGEYSKVEVTPLYASPQPADVVALRDEDHIEAVVKIVERQGGRGHKNTVALLRALEGRRA